LDQVSLLQNFFPLSLTLPENNPECMSFLSPFSLVYYLQIRPETVANFKSGALQVFFITQGSDLTRVNNCWTNLKRLAKNKHSSLRVGRGKPVK